MPVVAREGKTWWLAPILFMGLRCGGLDGRLRLMHEYERERCVTSQDDGTRGDPARMPRRAAVNAAAQFEPAFKAESLTGRETFRVYGFPFLIAGRNCQNRTALAAA